MLVGTSLFVDLFQKSLTCPWGTKSQQTVCSGVLPCKWFFIHPWLHLLICDPLGYLWKYMRCFIVAKALPLPRHCWCQALRKVQKNCQTLSVNSDPLHLFVESLLLDMFFLGIPLLRGGVRVLIFHKVSFEKHSSAGPSGPRASRAGWITRNHFVLKYYYILHLQDCHL